MCPCLLSFPPPQQYFRAITWAAAITGTATTTDATAAAGTAMPNDPSPFVVVAGTTQSRRESHCGHAKQSIWIIVAHAGSTTDTRNSSRHRTVDSTAAALASACECPAPGTALLQHPEPIPAAVREWAAVDGRPAVVEQFLGE